MQKSPLLHIFENQMTIKQAQRPDFLPTTEYTGQVGTKPVFLPAQPKEVGTGTDDKTPHFELDAPHASWATPSLAVKQMQEAIVTFGKILSTHPVMSGGGQQERPNSKTPDFLGGTTPFGNFLVNQYINNAKVVGEQFVNIDLPQPLRSNTARPNVNLAGIINTITHIGTPGAENKADGLWQARTNNALKQIYAVGKSLLQMAKDLNVTIGGFGKEDLDDMGALIPAAYTELKGNVENRAQVLTKHINDLIEVYQKFEQVVLEDPELKPLIEQEKAFADHSQDMTTPTTPEEQSLLEAHRDATIPGANVNGKPVTLADVENLTAFEKFLKGANVDISKPTEVQKQITSLKHTLAGTDLGPGF